ncbi:methyl-accepting chemotaxis protein [Bordetella sp. FB-8]|uniref:methyl-accepting chemotaxis protein n=1 Tax=Bordetella sp. FB-8 TaxID=1159870 RepID=UPI00036B7299|nr:methyl-accepting chemotaxis protein [Bordetella sp. FB-8]
MIRFRSLQAQVDALSKKLLAQYSEAFRLDPSHPVEIKGRQTPLMLNGDRPVSLQCDVLDRFEQQTGSVASILARTGDDFIRVATSVKDSQGNRALGVVLDRSHPAYALNQAGKSYFGNTTLAGRKFVFDYRPIYDDQGRIIGIFAVGLDISRFRILSLAESLGLSAFAMALVLQAGLDFLTAAFKSRSGSLNWINAWSSLGMACLFGLGVYAVIQRKVGRQLQVAQAAARLLASGDLSRQIAVKRGDEIGLLFDALNGINTGLANLVSNVRTSTDTLAVASRQIAAGNAELSSRTETQASSLEQTAAAMDQLTSTVHSNAENAEQANRHVGSTFELASQGSSLMGQAVATMHGIRSSSGKVAEIVGTIEGIAFQTNILALNAAVEAARAGEQGKGFAVVAGEVRTLAQRSAEAARQIKSLITDSVGKVNEGSQLIDQAGQTMTQIVASVQEVTQLMSDIHRAGAEQSTGIEEVNRAVSHMDEMTQQNAALVEEAAAAAASMQEQAGSLARSVGVFKLAL